MVFHAIHAVDVGMVAR